MNTKGNLSLNVIVMAVIALLVLVVLSYIFINGAGTANQGLLSCDSKGGECSPKSTGCADSDITASWQCEDNTKDNPQVCCIDKEDAFGFS